METFLEFLREVLKGIVREVSAFFFKKSILEEQENHPTPSQAKGWFSEVIHNILTTITLTVEVVKEKC